ncbi:MAG TPA: metallopeptidase family protein [Gemmataceae bacterium]|jgi:predicted Zn-dependent protease with MMP-like domain|nr:metallopeptidase family protein [Gemmataceae bacterium]
MKRMSLRRFGELVARVLETLPEGLRPYLENVVVDVQEEPDEELLREQGFTEEEIAEGATLYGLFVPFPLPNTEALDCTEVPHRILIFKRPLEEDFPDRHELRQEIRKTVIHELGHHFGLNEHDLKKLGLE